MFATSAVTSLRAPCRPSRPLPRRSVAPKAFMPAQLITQLAEAAPGSVDAPVGAVVIGAIVVTALSFAVSAGLKPGSDAASQMQKRDAKKFNKYDK